MNNAFRAVFIKEMVANFRDHRTLMSALLGPLLAPLVFVVAINFELSRALDGSENSLELPVLGSEAAPTLISFLEQENISIHPITKDRADTLAAVDKGSLDLALVIPKDFGTQLRSNQPVRLEIIVDLSNTKVHAQVTRMRSLLRAWEQQISALRLVSRGINPVITHPLLIDEIDTSTPSGRSAVILGMLTYLFLLAMLMGGMYLCIDTTAGERERGELEPLLALPISRSNLVVGKIAAGSMYMLASLAISLLTCMIALPFLPLEKLGMNANFGPAVAISAWFILAPFALLGSSLMTIVASLTKSYKEAQTYLSFVILLPTLPILIAALMTLRPSPELMLVPSLSQHLLITELIKSHPIEPLWVVISVGSTLLSSLALVWVAVRAYRREGILI
ncbi:MAG: ABC transporter permease [Myxococcales bacterium]|nr:ABC transporter permease [Myxococcales bacterium]